GALFQEWKSEARPRDLVKKMSGGQRQAVAIARTRLSKAKLILMDEPTAAISIRQVAEVLGLIRRLKAQGVSVILISHRMPDVFEVCDRIIVLRRGAKVADKQTTGTSPEEGTGLITGAIRAACSRDHQRSRPCGGFRRCRRQGADAFKAVRQQPAFLGDGGAVRP